MTHLQQRPFSSGMHSQFHISVTENLIGLACLWALLALLEEGHSTDRTTAVPRILRDVDTLCIRQPCIKGTITKIYTNL